jgi:hypothetical protein
MATNGFRTIYDEMDAMVAARRGALAKLRGQAEDVWRVLGVRGVKLTDEQLELLGSCLDIDQLDRWFYRSMTATSAHEVFGD